MRSYGLIRSCTCRLTLAWDSPLANSQVAVHEIVAILLGVRIIESQLVTHLMHDGRQQIDVTRWRVSRVRIEARCRCRMYEAQV